MKTTVLKVLTTLLVPVFVSTNTYATPVTTESHSEESYVENMDKDYSDQEKEHDYAIRVVDKANAKIRNKDLTGGVDYFIQNIQYYKYDNDELLYYLATEAESMRDMINQYSTLMATTYNGYNAGTLLAEAYNNSNRVIKLNAIMIEYCIKAAEMGHDDAQLLLNKLKIQAQSANPGYQNNNTYQNNSNNEYRKKQLLDNIATYEKRIRETQSYMGNGIATDMMGNQTIANYRRMIEDAKRELRSMGYNIY